MWDPFVGQPINEIVHLLHGILDGLPNPARLGIMDIWTDFLIEKKFCVIVGAHNSRRISNRAVLFFGKYGIPVNRSDVICDLNEHPPVWTRYKPSAPRPDRRFLNRFSRVTNFMD